MTNRIVFGSANHWTSPYQVGSHAWARLFAKNAWNVTYISDPISPLHWLSGGSKDRLKERFELHQLDGRQSIEKGICAWVPFSLFSPVNKPVLREGWVLNSWHRLTHPSVREYLNSAGIDQSTLVWLDSVRHFEWAKEISPKQIIFRLADWSPGFPDIAPSILDYERKVVREADLVITSAQSLTNRISSWREQGAVFTIRNGVDFQFWSTPVEMPSEYQNIPGPRIVYVGALDSWFNFDLLKKLATQFPKYSFVIIGQIKNRLDASLSLPNLHFIGPRKRSEVRGYLQHAQAGIIPFIRNDLIDCVCPLKLYEYAACGLPIVSTYWEEVDAMQSPALLARNDDEWIHALSRIELVQSVRSKAELVSYAQDNDWSIRWLELMQARTPSSL